MPKRIALGCALAALAFATACDVRTPTDPGTSPPEEPGPDPRVLGLVEVTISGIGTAEMQASIRPFDPATEALPDGVSASLTPLPLGSAGGIQTEVVSTGSFTEGTRGIDGQRYLHATIRVRNAASDGTAYGTARSNVTFVPVEIPSSITGTPISQLRFFDGTALGSAAAASLAVSIVPTGAVRLGDTLQMEPAYVDVLQVFEESEVTSLGLPSVVTDVFPYGFVTRNPRSSSDRTLPANPATDEWDGLATIAYRLPLQSDQRDDPYSLSVVLLAMEDSETRVTEAIEEQTPTGRAAVAARAAALSATTVTVLAGSPSTGYTGQRQICDVRTAGTAASPTTRITEPGAYTRVAIYREGETVDACGADFIGGTAGRPAVGVPFDLTVRAMDRYGNVLTSMADTIEWTSSAGSTTLPSEAALTNGEATFALTFNDYGTPVVTAEGTRKRGAETMNVEGVTRTWTGSTSSAWTLPANWDVGAPPAALDTAIVPTGTPNSPVLSSNTDIGGVSVANGATLTVGIYDLTATANVSAGQTSGGIVGTTGSVVLDGTSGTVEGLLPTLEVNGAYSLSGNLTLRAPAVVSLARLTSTGNRITITSY